MKRASYGTVLVGMLLFLTLGAGLAQGNTLTFQLNKDFDQASAGSTNYLTAVFNDSDSRVDPGAISLELFVSALAEGQYVKGWYFNFEPDDQVSNLLITRVPNTGTGPNPRGILEELDSYRPDGDGYFDFKFTFPTNGDRFGPGENLLFQISAPDSLFLTLNLFRWTSEQKVQGEFVRTDLSIYYSAADVQRGEENWIGAVDFTDGDGTQDDPQPDPVPEPATLLLLGSGLLGVAAGWRRKLPK